MPQGPTEALRNSTESIPQWSKLPGRQVCWKKTPPSRSSQEIIYQRPRQPTRSRTVSGGAAHFEAHVWKWWWVHLSSFVSSSGFARPHRSEPWSRVTSLSQSISKLGTKETAGASRFRGGFLSALSTRNAAIKGSFWSASRALYHYHNDSVWQHSNIILFLANVWIFMFTGRIGFFVKDSSSKWRILNCTDQFAGVAGH